MKFECSTVQLLQHIIQCKFNAKSLIYRIYLQICQVLFSDVNKDVGLKTKAKAKDLDPKAKDH